MGQPIMLSQKGKSQYDRLSSTIYIYIKRINLYSGLFYALTTDHIHY